MRFWLQTLAYIAVLFAGLEVASRLALGHAPFERFDKRYDRLTAPHQPVVQSSEGWSRSTTNELGHLDEPMPTPLPPDGILVIGDSYTEARQVRRDDRYTERLGAQLHRRVYNVGHTGWSPLNALALLRAERATFAPKAVVVQISGNDLADIVAKRRPHVVERADHTGYDIALPPREKGGLGAKITQARLMASHSALAGNIIVSALTLLHGGKDDEGGKAETSCAAPAPLAVAALPWLFESLDKAAGGPDLVLLYLPQLDYHAGCVDRCAASRELYRRTAEQAHIPFVDPTPAMCSEFARTRQPLNGFWNTVPGSGHFNARGHAVIADALAAALR